MAGLRIDLPTRSMTHSLWREMTQAQESFNLKKSKTQILVVLQEFKRRKRTNLTEIFGLEEMAIEEGGAFNWQKLQLKKKKWLFQVETYNVGKGHSVRSYKARARAARCPLKQQAVCAREVDKRRLGRSGSGFRGLERRAGRPAGG